MNIARNTNDTPTNGIFANKSTRAMRPTSIDRMTVITVNTFRRCRARQMELRGVAGGRLSRWRDLASHSTPCPDDEAHDGLMETKVDEIGPDVFRLSTWVPDVTEHGFTFNQFLLTGDEPFLFHCGHRQLFP